MKRRPSSKSTACRRSSLFFISLQGETQTDSWPKLPASAFSFDWIEHAVACLKKTKKHALTPALSHPTRRRRVPGWAREKSVGELRHDFHQRANHATRTAAFAVGLGGRCERGTGDV